MPPRVSVLVTIKDDPEGADDLLRALFAQTVKPDEVVLAIAEDSASTLAIVGWWCKRWSAVRSLKVGRVTRGAGRNQAANIATGEILLITDAGCIPDTHWVESLSAAVLSDPEVLWGGKTWVGSGAWDQAQAPFILVPPTRLTSDQLPATRNLALHRCVWNQVGPFPEHHNTAEDYAWCLHARSLGVQTKLCRAAQVTWQVRPSLLSFSIMVTYLTGGDVLSRSWRKGHGIALLRLGGYAGLLLLLPLLTAAQSILLLILAQATAKTVRQHHYVSLWHGVQVWWYTVLLEALVELAVPCGLLLGSIQRCLQWKQTKLL